MRGTASMMRRGRYSDGLRDSIIMEPIDFLIAPRWTIPVEPDGVVLERHAIAVRDGRIVAILPQDEAARRFPAAQVHEAESQVAIPGLINAHTHAAMNLFKGMSDDLPLKEWLEEHIWPAEQRWISEGFVRDGTRLAAAEMLLGGTTCFNDMYFYPDTAALAAAEIGIRAVVGLIVLDFPSVWAGSAAEYLAKGAEVHDRLRGHPLARTAFAPHAPYTVGDEALTRIATLAEELDIPVHMHLHETAHEVAESETRHAERPLARIQRLGLLSPRLVAVHMTTLTDDEIARLAEHGAHVVHCPQSNLKLASGLCPVERLRVAGVNLALGTDGAASNNDLSMLGELRSAALLAKGVARDARALPARAALGMATLGAARALGLDQEIGSLMPGKAVDITLIDLASIHTQPTYNPLSQIIYAAGRHQVSHVWVGGRQVVRNGELLTEDVRALCRAADQWRGHIESAAH